MDSTTGSRNFALVLNRGSGGNERDAPAEEIVPRIKSIFRKNGHEIITLVADPGKLESTLKKAHAMHPDALLIGGGDGSVATAAGILAGSATSLGILPMGTFNLAARDLGVPLDIDEAAQFLATASTHEIDILNVAGRPCLCTTILGFYPEFSHLFEKRDHGGKWWKKSARIVTGLKQAFQQSRSIRLKWITPEDRGFAKTKFAAFVPGRYRPAIGLIPAREGFTAGTLTAYIGHQHSAAKALRGIFSYAIGNQDANDEISVVTSSEITLHNEGRSLTCKAMIDGEILRLRYPIEMKIQPKHLRVLAAITAKEKGTPES